MTIEKVAVIGAGSMGAGVAGQAANAGLPVLLLDIKSESGSPNAMAEQAVRRLIDRLPPALIDPDYADSIEVGNVEDDLARLGECDFVLEAVVERLDVKHALYQRIAPHLKPGAMVASNTSTIPIAHLVEPMDSAFRRRFCITHFFNPVRQMRLLELVGGEETEPAVLDELAEFCDRALGKSVIRCADSPGFLANRVGVFALQVGIDEALRAGLDIEVADALMGRPMGIPKTGVFGLYDLIGVDLMADVVRSLTRILPEGDAFHAVGGESPVLNRLCETGFIGVKSGKGGFYRPEENLAYDLTLKDWRPRRPAQSERAAAGEQRGLQALIVGQDPEAQFCRRALARVLAYSAAILPEATASPQDIDDAMKLGYNWVKGPFEMLDEIGPGRAVDMIEAEGVAVPPFLAGAEGRRHVYAVRDDSLSVRWFDGERRPVVAPPGGPRLSQMKPMLRRLSGNDAASLWRLGDDVVVEFHTKANALNDASMTIVHDAARQIEDGKARGAIIYNEGMQFSAGVDLNEILDFCTRGDWSGLDQFLKRFQDAVKALKYAPGPVVCAASGLTLGGGLEVALHCDKVIAHANITIGLVESLVGVVPGGGGVKETYLRWMRKKGDWREAARKTFMNIGYGSTGGSPVAAARLGYYCVNRDSMVMNRDRLLSAAQAWIAEAAPDYAPPAVPEFRLAGAEAHERHLAFLREGHLDGHFVAHDVTVGAAVSTIVTGGPNAVAGAEVSEDDLYSAERAQFLELAQTDPTRRRIAHMLSHGEPLRI